MLRSILIGIVAGARSLTPLSAVSIAASRGALPEDDRAVRLLGHPLAVAGTTGLALAEMGGDKMKSAPDRIILPGMAARVASASIAGAALATRDRRVLAGAAAAAAAVASAYITWNLRIRAMERYGQTSTGLIEDTLVAASAAAIAR